MSHPTRPSEAPSARPCRGGGGAAAFPTLMVVAVVLTALGGEAAAQQTSPAGGGPRADSLPARSVSPAPRALEPTERDLEVELYGSSREVAPGALATIRWSLMSFETVALRVRASLELPPGWARADAARVEGEWTLEAGEEMDGEAVVLAPAEARPGDVASIRMLVELVDEPGSFDAFHGIRIARGAGGRRGAATVSGTVAVAAVGVGGQGDPVLSAEAELSGRLDPLTSISLSWREGPVLDRTTNGHSYLGERRVSGAVRRGGWELGAGNQLASPGDAVAGPFVRAEGVRLRRSTGLVRTDVTVGRPTTWDGRAEGRLLRGAVGLHGSRAALIASGSDFERPRGGYGVVAPQDPAELEPDSLAAREREERLAAGGAQNRVTGVGGTVELRAGAGFRMDLRAGHLRLEGGEGEVVAAVSWEASYAMARGPLSLQGRWRDMPAAPTGVRLPGDERMLDASLRIAGGLHLVGRGSRWITEAVDEALSGEVVQRSAGVRLAGKKWRSELLANGRRAHFHGSPVARRTLSVSVGAPLAPAVSLVGWFEGGREERGVAETPFVSLHGQLRWRGAGGDFASLGASHGSDGSGPVRRRVDATTGVTRGGWSLAGGAWAASMGSDRLLPGLWTRVGAPVTGGTVLLLGAEHHRAWGTATGPWRLALGLRNRLALPLAFLPGEGR